MNPTRPIGSGISINRLSRDTKASLLTRLGMVRKPSSPRFMPGPGNSTRHFDCSILLCLS